MDEPAFISINQSPMMTTEQTPLQPSSGPVHTDYVVNTSLLQHGMEMESLGSRDFTRNDGRNDGRFDKSRVKRQQSV